LLWPMQTSNTMWLSRLSNRYLALSSLRPMSESNGHFDYEYLNPPLPYTLPESRLPNDERNYTEKYPERQRDRETDIALEGDPQSGFSGSLSSLSSLGTSPQEYLNEVLRAAKLLPFPQEALIFRQASVRLLVKICRILHDDGDGDGFYLACRTAGALLGVTHRLALRYLHLLCHRGILEMKRKGNEKWANRYRYVGGNIPPKAPAEPG